MATLILEGDKKEDNSELIPQLICNGEYQHPPLDSSGVTDTITQTKALYAKR